MSKPCSPQEQKAESNEALFDEDGDIAIVGVRGFGVVLSKLDFEDSLASKFGVKHPKAVESVPVPLVA